jgi:ABC-2 type transport system ATP-binding protein
MISIEKLVVSYGAKKKVIECLNLQLSAHDIHGIVGLNGAGKTTLLNALYGLIKPTSGKIKIDHSELKKTQIAYLTCENFFYAHITGREYLSLFKNETFNVGKWNDLFLLPLDEIIDNYSTGMKKKLAILGVLKQDKPIVILDEPFNGLDIETCRIIRTVLLELKEKGKTIIITSHIIETLTNLCDKIHYLVNGDIHQSIEKQDFSKFESELYSTIEKRNDQLIKDIFK